jgi:hypothetical protein
MKEGRTLSPLFSRPSSGKLFKKKKSAGCMPEAAGTIAWGKYNFFLIKNELFFCPLWQKNLPFIKIRDFGRISQRKPSPLL